MNQNIHTPRISVDITQKDTVSTPQDKPRITKPTWCPEDGAARTADIVKARQQAFEEHQQYLKSLTPEEQRLQKMEAQIEALFKLVNHNA